jgi:hypothetical protein
MSASQSTHCVYTRKNYLLMILHCYQSFNLLMMFRKIIVVNPESDIARLAKCKEFWLLWQVVHVIITDIWRVKLDLRAVATSPWSLDREFKNDDAWRRHHKMSGRHVDFQKWESSGGWTCHSHRLYNSLTTINSRTTIKSHSVYVCSHFYST